MSPTLLFSVLVEQKIMHDWLIIIDRWIFSTLQIFSFIIKLSFVIWIKDYISVLQTNNNLCLAFLGTKAHNVLLLIKSIRFLININKNKIKHTFYYQESCNPCTKARVLGYYQTCRNAGQVTDGSSPDFLSSYESCINDCTSGMRWCLQGSTYNNILNHCQETVDETKMFQLCTWKFMRTNMFRR